MPNTLTQTANQVTLTTSQQNVFNEIVGFMITPTEDFFILKGSPGVGKSTMINHIVENFEVLSRMKAAIDGSELVDIHLTATTHDAANVISKLTGRDASTIHSKLGLRVHTEYVKGRRTTKLVRGRTKDLEDISKSLVIIDEAYAADYTLVKYITSLLANKGNKVILVGDPDQLLPFTSSEPTLPKHFMSAELTENMRIRDPNSLLGPTIDKLRTLVRTGTMPDGLDLNNSEVMLLDGPDFQAAVDAEFNRPDWLSTDSRILTWTNNKADQYDKYVRNIRGSSEFIQAGDTVYANGYFADPMRGYKIPNNSAVHVYDAEEHEYIVHDYGTVYGRKLETSAGTVYVPDNWNVVKDAANHLRRLGEYRDVQNLEEFYVNLTFRFASTTNRAQGTTLNKVFVDLSDINKCKQAGQMHRMLYVAASRARDQIIFTGSINLR